MRGGVTIGKLANTGTYGGLMVLALLLLPSLRSQESEAPESIEVVWQPKVYKFSRYQKMLAKSPFGKVPLNAPPPTVVEEAPPPEEKQLAIAAVSVVEGKPVVYLVDLKTRAYQKINTEEENESKIRLIEISDVSNPRDVVAKVKVNGLLRTVKYDYGLLDAKPKLVAKRKGRPINVAAKRPVQTTREVSPALAQNVSVPQGGQSPGELVMKQSTNRVVPVVRSIVDQRRLSTVPRRRVIVPGQAAPRQLTPTQ